MRTLGKRPLKLLLAMCISSILLLSAPSYADFAEGQLAFEKFDYRTALAEWEPLAEQGNVEAQYGLGYMFQYGGGQFQDYSKAAKWYRLAAAKGHGNAQYNLASMYVEGDGVIQDFAQAHMWLNIAAANGERGAGEFRDALTDLMTPEQVAQAQEMARVCLDSGYVDC